MALLMLEANLCPVSSLIAQGTEFPLKKPAGFHWDLFLLGLTTGVAGLLGIPFPNGLIPQAPFHTESLCDSCLQGRGRERREQGSFLHQADPRGRAACIQPCPGPPNARHHDRPVACSLALDTTGCLGRFILHHGLPGPGGERHRRPRSSSSAGHHPRLRRSSAEAVIPPPCVWLFVGIELVGFAATFAITQSCGCRRVPSFYPRLDPRPGIAPPRWFTSHELSILDGPTASPFTMESVGGFYGGAPSRLPTVGRATRRRTGAGSARTREEEGFIRRYCAFRARRRRSGDGARRTSPSSGRTR